MATLDNAAVEKNQVNRIFKDDRSQAEYEKRMKTLERSELTEEQAKKVKKVKELSARFFNNAIDIKRRKLGQLIDQVGAAEKEALVNKQL